MSSFGMRTLGLALALAVLIGSGCRPSGEGSESKPAPEIRTNASVRNASPGSPLQGLLNDLESVALEWSPAKRPRVLSEKAADDQTWVFQALVRGSRESGFADGPGAAEARVAYEQYARVFTGGLPSNVDPVLEAARSARDAGSKDPMLQYMLLRYSELQEGPNAQLERARGLVEVARAVHGTRHHPIFKFLAANRAAWNVRDADRRASRKYLDAMANVHMEDVVRDTNGSPTIIAGYLKGWVRFASSAAWTDWVMGDTEKLLAENWAGSALYHGVMADVEVKRAWDARGSGYANTVKDEGWRKMEAHLAAAEAHLDKAWKMDPFNPELPKIGLTLEMGQGKGRAVALQWFQRAMTVDPNHYEACKALALYLEPKWHGSEAESLQFARQCVKSDAWGGLVPLVLVDVHHSLARWKGQSEGTAYWRQPQVWKDIQQAFEKFFRVNRGVESRSYRHNYAEEAFRCGKYDVFLEQVAQFGGRTNHAFFGGAARFEGMLAKARAESGGKQ